MLTPLVAGLLVTTAAVLPPLRVATLSKHHPNAWADGTCGDTSFELVTCNLRLYEAALAAAGDQNVSLLLMPEGYGLGVTSSRSSYFEEWIAVVGSTPRLTGNSSMAPQQVGLSAAAARSGVALVVNLCLMLPNGTRRISDVVFDSNGTILATYDKHHLFATELTTFSRGPFKPTTFTLGGHTFGLIICYEGIYPDLTGDWSQMLALKSKHADTFLWSVGGAIPLSIAGGHMSRKFNVSLVGSEDRKEGVVLGRDGESVGGVRDVHFAVPGYTESRMGIRVAHLS